MSENKNITPNLYEISNLLEINKINIANEWIKSYTVQAVFKSRKISLEKFRDGYGIPIIDYFISVAKEEKELGDCPIMSKLVNYLVSKDITPREVFDICMGFRRTLIVFLLEQKIVLKNPLPYMQEVAIIFDTNLSGVLDIFTNLHSNVQKKTELVKSQKLKLQQTLKILNFINTKIIMIQNNRIILANKPFLEMLGVENLKELYVNNKKDFEFLGAIDLYENDFRLNSSKWIKKVVKANKPFKCEIYNENLKKKFSYSGRITVIPNESIKQYIITFSNISKHIKDEEILQDNLLHDELTGFRNYPTFEKFITKKIEYTIKEKSRIFLAVADIPNLREINDEFGREKGDMVISEVAEDLRLFIDKNIYLARLEGSRFGILIQYETEQDVYNWCVKLYKKMNERKFRKTISITEVDLSESINKLFLRVYDLIETSNNYEDDIVSNDFSNIIEYNELPDQQEFIDKLSKYISISISVFYMELAITSEVDILSAKDSSLELKFSKKQIKVSNIDMAVYFTLQYIGNIKAYIKEIDKNKNTVIIDRFRFDKHTPLNRDLFRIKVTDNIRAYIEENNREYTVELIDINYSYVAIKIDRKRNFDINALIFLDMMLPIDDIEKSCALNATIIRIEKIIGGYKMVLLLHEDKETKKIIREYISQKQMKIVKSFQSNF